MERCCIRRLCAVLAWPEEHKLSIKETRRVQLAARSGHTLAIFFAPLVPLPLQLSGVTAGLAADRRCRSTAVDIIKRKGGWPVQNIRLCLDVTRYQQWNLCMNSWLFGKARTSTRSLRRTDKEQEIKQETARGALAAVLTRPLLTPGYTPILSMNVVNPNATPTHQTLRRSAASKENPARRNSQQRQALVSSCHQTQPIQPKQSNSATKSSAKAAPQDGSQLRWLLCSGPDVFRLWAYPITTLWL